MKKHYGDAKWFRFCADRLFPDWSFWVLGALALDVPYFILNPATLAGPVSYVLLVLGLLCYLLFLLCTGLRGFDPYEDDPALYRLEFFAALLLPLGTWLFRLWALS